MCHPSQLVYAGMLVAGVLVLPFLAASASAATVFTLSKWIISRVPQRPRKVQRKRKQRYA
jgi:hypothetical protein